MAIFRATLKYFSIFFFQNKTHPSGAKRELAQESKSVVSVKTGTDLHVAAVMQHETCMVPCMFMKYARVVSTNCARVASTNCARVASTNCARSAAMLWTAPRTNFYWFLHQTQKDSLPVEARFWRSVNVNLCVRTSGSFWVCWLFAAVWGDNYTCGHTHECTFHVALLLQHTSLYQP